LEWKIERTFWGGRERGGKGSVTGSSSQKRKRKGEKRKGAKNAVQKGSLRKGVNRVRAKTSGQGSRFMKKGGEVRT